MREIGRYRIEREIGRGGMGVVYLARQLDLGRAVALKELGLPEPTLARRFVHEAQLAGSLNHPNIVTVHEYFEHGGVPYIAMEYLPRGSLRLLVATLPFECALVVLDGILAGLAHACEHRIVHRDLKPENVMRSDDGGVKIADFGIAKAQDDVATANLTPPGEFVGAPAYVSPEQVLGSPAAAASDLYAVGVIAFELLAGEVPFAGGGAPSTMLFRKVNERAPSLRSRRSDLDPALTDWVDRLLERDPERRPSDPGVAREALEDLAERLVGPRWRREGTLPADVPERTPVAKSAPPAHRFAPLRTLRRHAPPRDLALHALTRPLPIALALAIVVVGAAVAAWLVAVAVVVYVALAAITFFDEAEAAAVAQRSH
jgi:serine/threonine protein kinase